MAALTFTAAANAQQVVLGLKGGLNIAEILTSTNQNIYLGGVPQGIRNLPRTDLNGGIFASVHLTKKFTLQPEVVYSGQGATGNSQGGNIYSATETYNFHYVNVPVLLKFNSPLGLFAETGPQVGLLLSARVQESVVGNDNTSSFNVKNQFKSTDFAWVLGVGYLSTFHVGIDIRYNLGLSNFSNSSTSGIMNDRVQNGSIKNSVTQIGLFYMFGKPRVEVGGGD